MFLEADISQVFTLLIQCQHTDPNCFCLPRGKLCLCIRELLQESWLHEERQPQLVCEREGLGQPEEPAVLGFQSCQRAPRVQRLCPAQARHGDAQRREATQSRPRPPEQENCALLWAGAHRHHGGHQAGKWYRQEDLHARRQAGKTHHRLLLSFRRKKLNSLEHSVNLKFVTFQNSCVSSCGGINQHALGSVCEEQRVHHRQPNQSWTERKVVVRTEASLPFIQVHLAIHRQVSWRWKGWFSWKWPHVDSLPQLTEVSGPWEQPLCAMILTMSRLYSHFWFQDMFALVLWFKTFMLSSPAFVAGFGLCVRHWNAEKVLGRSVFTLPLCIKGEALHGCGSSHCPHCYFIWGGASWCENQSKSEWTLTPISRPKQEVSDWNPH